MCDEVSGKGGDAVWQVYRGKVACEDFTLISGRAIIVSKSLHVSLSVLMAT